jgi:hypothetical protein
MHIQRRVLNMVAGASALAAALAVGGTTPPASAAMSPCKSPPKFRGAIAETYTTYCEVCRDTGWRQIRRDYLIKTTVIGRIALAYATVDQFGAYRPAATQGCLRGFKLRGKP